MPSHIFITRLQMKPASLKWDTHRHDCILLTRYIRGVQEKNYNIFNYLHNFTVFDSIWQFRWYLYCHEVHEGCFFKGFECRWGPGSLRWTNRGLRKIYSISAKSYAFNRRDLILNPKNLTDLPPAKPAEKMDQNQAIFTVFYLILQYFTHLAWFLKKYFPSLILSFKAL